ncbi:MAG: DUF1508 domain-containing protein [Actinomycetota bacterium]|nr:DUF1508 domain-containing protein [Actinomycetota bacterium]
MPGKFVIKKGPSGRFRFNLLSTNGQVVATSEAYNSKASAMTGIRAVKSLAPDAEVDDQTGSARASATPAHGDHPHPASDVAGGACGYFTDVGLFGGPPERRGCGQTVPPAPPRSESPQVELPAGGSSVAVTAVDEDGVIAQYGPAILLGGRYPGTDTGPTGPVVVSTKGKTSVTSSASVKNIDAGVFTAGSVRSTCTASKAGRKGSTTVTKGVVITAANPDGTPKTTKAVPSKPAANLKMSGTNSIGDKFKVVFNEQKKSRDGTLTVIAVHIYLLGPTAIGEVVIAESHARV